MMTVILSDIKFETKLRYSVKSRNNVIFNSGMRHHNVGEKV